MIPICCGVYDLALVALYIVTALGINEERVSPHFRLFLPLVAAGQPVTMATFTIDRGCSCAGPITRCLWSYLRSHGSRTPSLDFWWYPVLHSALGILRVVH